MTLITTFFSVAQTLKVEDKNGNDISKTEVTSSGLADDFEITYHMYVRNTSGSNYVVKAKRIEIDVDCGTEHALCWDVCPPPIISCTSTIAINTTSVTINAGEVDETGVGHLYPNNIQGTSKYRYVFYLESDENDSTYIDVVYNHSALSIKDNKQHSFVISPNPTSNYVNVKVINGRNYTIQLINILGKEMLKQTILSDKSIDVSSFDRGVYFIKITDENGVEVKTSKIVLE